jgi:hypothetical protein
VELMCNFKCTIERECCCVIKAREEGETFPRLLVNWSLFK